MNLDHLDFDIVSTVRCPVEDFVPRISDFASLGISTTVERSLQISLFMQNKPNFPDALMSVSTLITKDYENIANWTLGENKPNTKPIKANFQKGKMNVNKVLTRDYENNSNWALFENKPNINAKQTQSNPISKAKKCCCVLNFPKK